MNLTHADLLWLRLNARPFLPEFEGVLALGPAVANLPAQWQQLTALPSQTVSICFGLPLLTEPYTLILNSLYTERNTQIRTLSAYGWIDENAIYEPRAELIGITSIGTQPVTFLRDLDLDLLPVAYVSSSQEPSTLIRLNRVLIVQPDHFGPPVEIAGQSAALAGICAVAPPDFSAMLKAALAQGLSLRAALKPHRRTLDPALLALADGWAILARATKCLIVGG
ncbi:MAG: hypothetical protein KIH69_014700 [Anaerolineae bacterium]|nr:hypothetical protein [Anaerolineae bacterium]